MWSRRITAVGLAMLMLAGMLMPLAGAENDSLHVVMTVADRHYSVGDTISPELRVYQAGVLADADTVTVWVNNQPNFNTAQELNATRQDTGVYTVSYTITASDAHHNIYFFYEVRAGTDHEAADDHNEALVVDVYAVEDSVDVSFGGQDMVTARPGDRLTATILVRAGDTLIPITGFDHLYIEDGSGNRENLTYATAGTGVYMVNYTVSDMTASGMLRIFADPMDVGANDDAYIFVNVLDVWYHKVMVSGNTVSFELCVSDLDGQPVPGATYVLARNAWPYDSFTGTTNESGKALVHVPDVQGQVGMSGYVLANGLNQSVEGTVFNPMPAEPNGGQFDVVWEGSQTVFRSGEDISIPYGAYDEGVPAGGQTVYFYVEAWGTDFDLYGMGTQRHVDGAREVLAAGSVTTSPTGKFNVQFTAPDTQAAIYVTLEVPIPATGGQGQGQGQVSGDADDDLYYAEWPQNAWNTRGFRFYAYQGEMDGSSQVSIGGGRFRPGEEGTVTVSMEKQPGSPTYAFWGIGAWDIDSTEDYDPEWMIWTPAGNVLALHETEGNTEGNFLVPSFIDDQDVTIMAGFVDAGGIPHFDSRVISPGGGFGLSIWLILAIIIIIIAVVAVVVYLKFYRL